MGGGKRKIVLVLIEREGKFVLIKRKEKLRLVDLVWAFPGGVTDAGEAEADAAVREAKQEVGLELRAVNRLFERIHPGTMVDLVYFEGTLADEKQEPIIGEPEEISEVEWVPAEEVIGRFTSDVHPKIQEYIESKIHKGV